MPVPSTELITLLLIVYVGVQGYRLRAARAKGATGVKNPLYLLLIGLILVSCILFHIMHAVENL